ncbi:MAG: ATP-binding cassette domain-containing protein [Alphaproteobacteria bacterium]
MLTVKDLHAGYGTVPILTGLSMQVKQGEFIGILGHNGMGKTTLLRTLMGYVRATAGSVTMDGADITRASTHARARLGIGFVPQGREIFPALSVLDNLRMGMVVRKTEEAQAVERILADFPRLERLLDRVGGALSGGEQQLLALARTLCTEPRLLLLDEPTEGIQPSIIDEIEETLQRLRKSRDLTVVLVEQNLDFIAALAERVLIIQKGMFTRELGPEHLADAEMVGEFVGFTT